MQQEVMKNAAITHEYAAILQQKKIPKNILNVYLLWLVASCSVLHGQGSPV